MNDGSNKVPLVGSHPSEIRCECGAMLGISDGAKGERASESRERPRDEASQFHHSGLTTMQDDDRYDCGDRMRNPERHASVKNITGGGGIR